MCRQRRSDLLILAFSLLAAPLLLGPVCISPPTPPSGAFHETWDPTLTGSSYLPELDAPTPIPGSEGNWYLGATVTAIDDTPHYAEVIGDGDAKQVRIVSNRSLTGYADNIWLWWDKDRSGGSQTIRITPDTRISFAEAGETFGAQDSGSGWGHDNCGVLVCGIFFALSDTNGNVLVYRLQRPTDASESTSANRAEVFIEPEDGVYSRNLYDDFSRIPHFDPSNAVIQHMQLEVNPWDESTEELGWATIDDIKISDEAE